MKLSGYALGLAAVFAAALGVGKVAGPSDDAPPAMGHAAETAHGGTDTPHGGGDEAQHVPGGLQVAEGGYRFTPITGLGGEEPFAFQIIGPDGKPVTQYTPTHEKPLHLIVVRRDLSGFRHVHPVLAADGTWSIPLPVRAAGQYRAFADFQPAGRDEGLTLGVDLPVSGDYRPAPLPAPARSATVGEYTVTLDGELTPGTASKLTLTVHRNGEPVTDLEPYLGAYGHLVALRAGDLAYLHVHPDEASITPGPRITFFAEVPSAGDYRLYLDFQHAGQVRTAEFTATAA